MLSNNDIPRVEEIFVNTKNNKTEANKKRTALVKEEKILGYLR